LDNIFQALETARQTAECLLRGDPFEAWKQMRADGELHLDGSSKKARKADPTTTPNVKKIITRPMRRQLVNAVRRLDEYHRCLVASLNDLDKVRSLTAALESAQDLQSDLPLEAGEDCTKREQAEEEEEF
jgi:hypothetical protein